MNEKNVGSAIFLGILIFGLKSLLCNDPLISMKACQQNFSFAYFHTEFDTILVLFCYYMCSEVYCINVDYVHTFRSQKTHCWTQ